MRLAGAHAVITGGATGIGGAIARALCAEGAKLTLVGRRAEPLRAFATQLGAFAAPADATDRDMLEAALIEARAVQGPFTIAIANAGAAATAPFHKTTLDQFREMMAANLETTVNLLQLTVPDLRASNHGRIIAIASTAALGGAPYISAYAAAKHAVLGLVRSLARELAGTSVTVNALCPGFTDTALADEAAANIAAKTGRSADAARAELENFNPQGRLVLPEEVASAALWLCLPESRSINGQAIAIDGGQSA